MDQTGDHTDDGKIIAFPSASTRTAPAGAVDRAIGKAVRRRRLALNLSQVALAETVGVTVRQLRRYEMGEIKLSSQDIISLTRGLGFSVTTLLEFAERPSDEAGR